SHQQPPAVRRPVPVGGPPYGPAGPTRPGGPTWWDNGPARQTGPTGPYGTRGPGPVPNTLRVTPRWRTSTEALWAWRAWLNFAAGGGAQPRWQLRAAQQRPHAAPGWGSFSVLRAINDEQAAARRGLSGPRVPVQRAEFQVYLGDLAAWGEVSRFIEAS